MSRTDAREQQICSCMDHDRAIGERSENASIGLLSLVYPAIGQISERLMIEPSTGKIYRVDDCPYEGIEFVFNQENFWICMQLPSPDSDARAVPSKTRFDLDHPSEWERVLPKRHSTVTVFRIASSTATNMPQGIDASQPDAEGLSCTPDQQPLSHLEVPSSWVFRLHLAQDVLNMRCPRVRLRSIGIHFSTFRAGIQKDQVPKLFA